MQNGIHKKIKAVDIAKGYTKDTHRLRSPKKSFNKFIKFAPQFGITRIANITGLDTLQIPTYICCRPNSRALSVSQGKGLTDDSARISALMESIEAYHAERVTLPLKLASHAELKGNHDFCNLQNLQRLKHKEFNEHERIHWVEAYDYLNDCYKWLPYELVHTDYRTTPMCGHGFFPASSNGLASGNHIIEAAIHGACEVIERDSSVSWFLQGKEKRRETKVDPETVTDKNCLNIFRKFEEAGVLYGIWDMTGVTGLPCFICRILPTEPPPISSVRPSEGMGCHLSKDVALLRAVTEAAQSRLTFISGARDDLSREEYERFLTPDMHRKWYDEITAKNYKNYRDIESHENTSFMDDMEFIASRLKRAGLDELLITDLTRAEFGIPVVRVVIPGTNGEFNPQRSELVNRIKTFRMKEKVH